MFFKLLQIGVIVNFLAKNASGPMAWEELSCSWETSYIGLYT